MTNEDKGTGKGLLIGVFAGAAIGSVISLLFAPKSGKKLREEIKTKSLDFIEDADEYVSNAREKASQLIKDVKKKSELLVGDAEKKIEAFKNDSEKSLIDMKNKVENYIQTGKNKLEEERERVKSAIKVGVDVYKTEKKN